VFSMSVRMSATTLQDLLDWFATPSMLQPDAVTNEQAPAYPADVTPPTPEQLHSLKELLSPEAWLYLLRADDEMPVNELQVQRELQAHIARVLALIGQDLRAEPLTSPRIQTRFQWVQYQLLHASVTQVPPVYYEQAVRAHIDAARHQRELERLWQSLSPDLKAAYQQTSLFSAGTTSAADTPAKVKLNILPRTASPGSIHHPQFGEWLIQELARRPLPEIEPYLTLTWTLVTPETPLHPGDRRMPFSLDDIPYLIDLLDGDWSYQIPGGRQQLSRAREWFSKHQFILAKSAEDALSQMSAQQIALIHIYRGIPITTHKANQLAQQANLQSGGKIYQKYRKLMREEERLNIDGKKRSHLIKDIEAILIHLSGPAKKGSGSDRLTSAVIVVQEQVDAGVEQLYGAGERQGFAHEPAQACAQGGVEPLDVIGGAAARGR
jgi:hypothetical protein